MKLDSTTTANISTLAAMNPSTALVVLVLGIGLIYLLSLLIKNTAITQAIADRMDGNDETAETIKAIRADQLKSNEERKSQGQQIVAIQGRLDNLERTVFSLVRRCQDNHKEQG